MIKKTLTLLLAAAAISTTPIFAKDKPAKKAAETLYLNYPIVNVKNLDEQMIAAFMEGEVENVILEFTAGTTIPFSSSLTGNVINILPHDRDPIYFSFQDTLYIGITEEDFLFSSDLTQWSRASEFFTGDINLTIEPTPNGPSIQLKGDLNHH